MHLEPRPGEALADPGQLAAGPVLQHRRPVPGQLIAGHVVAARAHEQSPGRDLDVERARTVLGRDHRRGSRLVRGLVRAEAHIAVRPEHLPGAELSFELVQQRLQGCPHRALVHLAPVRPVGLRVVRFQPLVEVERVLGEAGEGDARSLRGTGQRHARNATPASSPPDDQGGPGDHPGRVSSRSSLLSPRFS